MFRWFSDLYLNNSLCVCECDLLTITYIISIICWTASLKNPRCKVNINIGIGVYDVRVGFRNIDFIFSSILALTYLQLVGEIATWNKISISHHFKAFAFV